MDEPTFSQLLDAAEAFEKEKTRWMIRHNKFSTDFGFEVCRRDDVGVPKFEVGTRTMAMAEYELDEQAAAAGMRAALAVVYGQSACREE